MYDIDISKDAIIEKGICINHFGGIRIGYCKIGKNCTISHQVKIATEDKSNQESDVILEDQIWVGAYSRINGSVRIEKGATISAGSIVNNNVGAQNLIAGQTGRILKKNFDNTRLLHLSVPMTNSTNLSD